MQRRLLAARIHYGITPDDLKGWLFYAAPKGVKLAEIRDGSRQIGMLETSLREAIERCRPDLIVLDPFVKLHALEENDNGAMDFVCDLLATLAIEYDVAIDAPHHTKKGQLAPGDADSGRGASAMRLSDMVQVDRCSARKWKRRISERRRGANRRTMGTAKTLGRSFVGDAQCRTHRDRRWNGERPALLLRAESGKAGRMAHRPEALL
jgi:RecA-family ATPase